MARTSSRPKTRAAEEQSTPKPRKSYTGLIIGVVVVGALIALVALDPPPPGFEFPAQGNVHLSAIDEAHPEYNSSPPSSGWHMGFLAEWGVSEEPLPPELYIHNLEDGGIVVAYNCPDGCDDLQTALSEFVESEGGRVVLTPYEQTITDPDGETHAAAVIAWKKIFYFDEFDEATRSEVETFISLYEGIDHHAGRGNENTAN